MKQYCSKCGKELGVFYIIRIDGLYCKQCWVEESMKFEKSINNNTKEENQPCQCTNTDVTNVVMNID